MWLFGRLFKRKPKQAIFPYWDGFKNRLADPMVVARMLEDDPEYRGDIHPKRSDDGDIAATAIVVAATRRALDVPPFGDKGGLTELAVMGLFVEFCNWLAALKKNTSLSPTS